MNKKIIKNIVSTIPNIYIAFLNKNNYLCTKFATENKITFKIE